MVLSYISFKDGINCDCFDQAIGDTENVFGLKINKPNIREADFKSYWEKGKRPEDMNECENACSIKGVSISIINETNIIDVIDTYKKLFPISPSYKPNICFLRFVPTSGVVKATPQVDNIHHYDLYKSDSFDHNHVQILGIAYLGGTAFNK